MRCRRLLPTLAECCATGCDRASTHQVRSCRYVVRSHGAPRDNLDVWPLGLWAGNVLSCAHAHSNLPAAGMFGRRARAAEVAGSKARKDGESNGATSGALVQDVCALDTRPPGWARRICDMAYWAAEACAGDASSSSLRPLRSMSLPMVA